MKYGFERGGKLEFISTKFEIRWKEIHQYFFIRLSVRFIQ